MLNVQIAMSGFLSAQAQQRQQINGTCERTAKNNLGKSKNNACIRLGMPIYFTHRSKTRGDKQKRMADFVVSLK
jgi:hypothetical protein